MIKIKSAGDFNSFLSFAKRSSKREVFIDLDSYGRRGVEALAAATPVDTGISASSWSYRIFIRGKRPSIEWFNNHVDENGTPIVLLVQYGHGTGTGGYVAPYDFINAAIQPIFDAIEDDVWKKVTQ